MMLRKMVLGFHLCFVKLMHIDSKLFLFEDVITCVSLDDDGHHLITGSRDTTCRLWEITHQGGMAQELLRTPLETLYGHDKPITCVAMSWELNMAVSGSQVGLNLVISYTHIGTLHRKQNLEITLQSILNEKRNTYFLSLKNTACYRILAYFDNTFFCLNGFDTTDTVIVQWSLHVRPRYK